MFVSSLEIENFRNLRGVSLQCSPGLNLVLGQNASGKTSLLEALYFLGRARSFRTRQSSQLICTGENAFRIVADMTENEGGRSLVVGIRRSAREITARIGGTPARSLAELAVEVPVLLLNPDSHRLLEGGPQQRRRFMDWGLFHSNTTFIDAWKRFNTALRNRNAALRMRSPDRGIDAWDEELNRAAITLDSLRDGFCAVLQDVLIPLISTLLGDVTIAVNYRRGWSQGEDLMELLHSNRNHDRNYGYTRVGPHRADFIIKINEFPATIRLSRGQHKLLVVGLVLAQAHLYKANRGSPCILLIDDLPAELDRGHRERVMGCLAGMDVQLFVTAIEAGLLDIATWKRVRVFNIEQGNVGQVA